MRRLGRVAYLCTDPGVPVFGTKGSSVHAQSVLYELAGRAEQVDLFTARPGGEPPASLAGVAVHELPRPTGEPAVREQALVAADAALVARLREVGASDGFDLVYQRYALWSCEGLELAAREGWPSVLEINAPLLDEQARHRNLADEQGALDRTLRAMRAATVAFGVSAPVAGWATECADRDVAVIPNGVDVNRFATRRSPASATASDEVVIGFVGTFKPWHDTRSLIDVVATVHADPRMPPVRLELIGDGPCLAEVIAAARRRGLGQVIGSTGAVAPDEIPGLLANLDIALAPYDGSELYFSPIKVFEYLAAGLPVVVSAVGGLDGLLADGHEALVVPPGDREAQLEALRSLCLDAGLRRRVGVAARRAAETRFGWDRAVDRVLELVEAA